MLSNSKVKKLKLIKPNEFDDQFIRDWNVVRRLVSMGLKRYEKLYRNNKDFREYVDRYMRNKEGVKLKDVLRMKQTQLVADMYESEEK